jgi:DNA-binding MarR family transcriptional regulator
MLEQAEIALIALRHILLVTEHSVQEIASRSGLPPAQMLVLNTIKSLGEVRTGDLSSKLRMKPATMSALLDRLESQGLVVRRRSVSDRRCIFVQLSRAGHDVLQSAPSLLQTDFRKKFEALADWEQAAIVAGLLRVAHLMGVDRLEVAPLLQIDPVLSPETDLQPS